MIPLTRPTLAAVTQRALERRALKVQTLGGTHRNARDQWSTARSVKQTLKRSLSTATFRAEFCMYCYESRGTDVDHFEPIARNPGLAFVWSNHVLACGYCNQQAKNEQFPVSPQGDILLIDPFGEDSFAHLFLGPSGEYGFHTDKGQNTIEALRLNSRTGLAITRSAVWLDISAHFAELYQSGRDLTTGDIDRFCNLAAVDVLHHFLHRAGNGTLSTFQVPQDAIHGAEKYLPELKGLFRRCRF